MLPCHVVREWISSFLSERTQQVAYNGRLSTVQRPVMFGVPQGSVLRQLLYVLYMSELLQVVARHHLRLHMYADDSQVYTSVRLPRTRRRGCPSVSACIATRMIG